MRGSLHHRLTAWLALAAALLMGVAPGQGFVLCFEPSGRVVLELAGQDRACDGCEDTAGGEEPSARVVAPATACCACLDIPVGVCGDEARARPNPVEFRFDAPLALSPVLPAPLLAPRLERSDTRHGAPPGPPGSLAHIRTVVLRV